MKKTTNFEPINDEDVLNKAYLAKKNRWSHIVLRKTLQRIYIT